MSLLETIRNLFAPQKQKPKDISAQESIPMDRMFPDGICRVAEGYYTKTIQFQDINYQLAQQEDQTAIFEEWCSFLNFFDSSIDFELSFLNTCTDGKMFEKWIRIPFRKDNYNGVRKEYSGMLKNQLQRGILHSRLLIIPRVFMKRSWLLIQELTADILLLTWMRVCLS